MKSTKQIAILAYGSLLAHPGDWFGERMEKLIRCETPFGVEYVGCSKKRGGAPTLAQWGGARAVRGGLIVLRMSDSPAELEETRRQLSLRETGGKNNHSKSIRDDRAMFGYRLVYSDFPAEFEHPTPDALADAAIDSVKQCCKKGHPFMNGIRYLRENIEWDVKTSLTPAYEAAILARTKVSCLEAAEEQLIREALSSPSANQ